MRVLWLKTELLHPIDKGGKIRTYQMLREMKHDHHVTYLTLDDGVADRHAIDLAHEYCHEVITIPHASHEKFSARFYLSLAASVFSDMPYALAKYRSDAMRKAIGDQVEAGKFDLVVCDFLTPGINMPDGLCCARVLFQHNVESMIWKRHYEVQSHPAKRAFLRQQYRKMWRAEKALCGRFDAIVAVSRDDRDIMEREYGVTRVTDIPTGVDTEFFAPSPSPASEPFELVFTGSMDWLPNQDAIDFFATDILPMVQAQLPAVTLTVVGRNPSSRLQALSRRNSAITVTGRVDDVRPYIARASGYVVPIRIGGGTRLKIYEAMAMGKAVISTSIGAEGLPVRDNVEIMLADTAEEFAAAVVRVLVDRNFADQLGREASRTVRTCFGWDKVATEFTKVCERAVEGSRTRI